MNEELKTAIHSARTGNEENAKRILWQIVLRDPDNESAWLWLSQVQKGEQQRLECLHQVLRINPDNHYARMGVDYLNARLGNTKTNVRPMGVTHTIHEPRRRRLLDYLLLTLLAVTLLSFLIHIKKD